MKARVTFLASWMAAGLVTLPAATLLWTGSTSATFDTAANWAPISVPANGDTLIFSNNAARRSITNTVGGADAFQTLTFLDDGFTLYTPPLTVSGYITNRVVGSNVIAGQIVLGGAVVRTRSTDSLSRLVLRDGINLNDNTLLFSHEGVVEINGAITNRGFVQKSAVGTVYLNASNTFTNALTLLLGTLSGTGSIPGIRASGGTVKPGPYGGAPGVLTCAGDLVMNDTDLLIEINGTTPGTLHDQVVVNGKVALTNATLSFNSTVVWDNYLNPVVLVNNDGTDAVLGTFTGLPEGALLTNGGLVLRISYVGGTGNDITLAPAAPSAVWDGGSPDGRFSISTNWQGDQTLGEFPALQFPAGVGRVLATNDFVANAQFHSLTFGGSNYVVSGNGLDVYAGITNNARSRTNAIVAQIYAQAPLSIVASQPAAQLVLNRIAQNGHALTFAGAGSMTVTGGLTTMTTILKQGSGTLQFEPVASGPSAAAIAVQGGRLVMNRLWQLATITLTNAGSTLSGTEGVGAVTAHAGTVVSPGWPETGFLRHYGTLTMNPGSIYQVNLAGPSQTEIGYLRTFNASSAVLNNPTLVLNEINPILGATSLKILEGPAISGTFAGLPEGTIFQLGPYWFEISYTASAVTIQNLYITPTGVTGTWTGLGFDANWSTGGNWLSGQVPANGDNYYFPAGAARATNTFNYFSKAAARLIFAGSYNIQSAGTILRLSDGFTITNGSQEVVWANPIDATSDQTWRNDAGLLRLTDTASLNLFNYSLTFAGAGTCQLEGPVRGQGNVSLSGGQAVFADLGIGLVRATNGTFALRNATNGPGRVVATNNFISGSNAVLAITHGGSGALPALNAAGQIQINGASLVLRVTGPVTNGNLLTLAASTNGITGQFAGIPEGGTVQDQISQRSFTVSYAANGGRLVTLTALALAQPTVFTNLTRLANGFVVVSGFTGPGLPIAIERSATLTNWSNIGLAPVSSGTFTFTDSNSVSAAYRFYRATR